MTGSDPTAQRIATAAFGVIFLTALAAFLAFDRHPGLAGLGDDSVSYLVQAHLYAGNASAAVRQWAGTATHFPPLFPLLLAACGAAHDMVRAHEVVAACAALALVAMFAFASRVVADRRTACALVAVFLATPTAWVSTLGILSDPPYLLASFALLAIHRDDGREASHAHLALVGIVLASAVLARSAGLALVAAYVVHAAVRVRRRESDTALLVVPMAAVAVAGLAWTWLRVPLVGENYGLVLRNVGTWIARDPLDFFAAIGRQLANAWVASFASAPQVGTPSRVVLLALAACAVAGAVRAARRNRLDGWYALAYLAMLCVWLFPEEIMRRLLYPLLPLALLHAGEALFALARRLRVARAWIAPAVAAAFAVSLAAPALVATAQRATDRRAPIAGSPLELAGMTPYYTSIADAVARVQAGRHLAILAGLEAIATRTPPGARVMWMRPDYVALLGQRTAVPWLYREGFEGALARMRDERVTHVVVASLVKGDLDSEGAPDGEFITAASLAPFTRGATFILDNPVRPGEEFRLVEIDRAALAAHFERAGAAVR